MADEPRRNESWPPSPPHLPQTGDEILREVERLKQAPMRFGCFGMSFGVLLTAFALGLLIWWFLL